MDLDDEVFDGAIGVDTVGDLISFRDFIVCWLRSVITTAGSFESDLEL